MTLREILTCLLGGARLNLAERLAVEAILAHAPGELLAMRVVSKGAP